MIICGMCKSQMRAVRNGVTVAPKEKLQHQYSGDEYSCKDCGQTIITSFGGSFHSDSTPNIILK